MWFMVVYENSWSLNYQAARLVLLQLPLIDIVRDVSV